METELYRLSCSYHSSVTLTGFVKHKKEIFSQKLRSFAYKACRKKNRFKRKTGNLSTDLPGLTSELSYYTKPTSV